MALLDIFKKKKGEDRFEKKQRERVGAEKTEKKETKKEESVQKARASIKASAFASKVLIGPHITEKSTTSGEKGIYIFKIRPNANKPMIKQAIKESYGVVPERVNIVHSPSKTRFVRGIYGTKKGFKKAMVYLKKGDKIEIA